MPPPTFFRRACAAGMLALAPPAWALPAGWAAVDAATLDGQRGGFTTTVGLDVSLGIERLVSINGELISRTSFQLADMARLDVEQARAASAALSTVNLIQNGGGNMALSGFSSDALGGTVIQNTLNDQHIASRTIINASVNSMALLKTINFNGNVGDAIAHAVVPR
jgi:hypothetical protein